MSANSAAPIHLNPRQREAVEHDRGPLLVVAGAGTGKTRVITERIRRLLESDPALSGENILGLTFTDKAAAEMKHRVVASAGERGKDVWLGTFHSFCLDIVLKPVEPDLEVIEEFDHWILLRRNIRELRPELYLKLHEPGQFLTDFLQFFSRCQDELVTAEDYDRYVVTLERRLEAERAQLPPEMLPLRELEIARQREVARAYHVSERLLGERRQFAFGSLLLEAERRLRTDEALAASLADRFRYILVDEFQDTNIAQIELLRRVAGRRRNLFVVGDDDQAIYRFRGASFASFQRFADEFLAAAGSAARYLALTENYRSTERILRVAGEVISQNRDRFIPKKVLVTPNPPGERIRVAEFSAPLLEAHWIAAEIERLHSAGNAWNSFAVLYRMHTHRDLLIRALWFRNIPFVIRGLSILESTLIRDLVACLRLAGFHGDDISFARVFAVPYWGFRPEDLVRLAQRAAHHRRSLLEELRAAPDLPRDTEADAAAVRASAIEFAGWIDRLTELARKASVTDLLSTLVLSLDLNLVPSSADELYLKRFIKFVSDWRKKAAAGGERARLSEFLEYLEYFFEARQKIVLEEQPADDAVHLMTAHGAKGLEFDSVFVIRLSRRAFPADKRTALLEFPAELMKEARPQGDFHVQEERRLFYVAITRARRRLTLTAVVNRRTKASPFLEDFLSHPQIQARDVERLSPQVELPPEQLEVASLPADPAAPALVDPARQNARAWSRIALWAGACHPPTPVPLELSATAIGTYNNCPQQYLFEKSWRLRAGPRAPLTFGNLMHSTIQQFVAGIRKGHPIPLDELLAIYRREWDPADYRDTFQEEIYRQAGEEQLQKFHARYLAAPPQVLSQEKTFALPLAPDLTITGRIDQMNRLEKNQAEVVDYKTGKAKTQHEADSDLQLSLYALAAREFFEVDPARLVLWYLKTDQRVETVRDDADLADARQKAIEIAAQIRAGQFDPRPGFLCRFCPYIPLCPAFEQLVQIRPATAGD